MFDNSKGWELYVESLWDRLEWIEETIAQYEKLLPTASSLDKRLIYEEIMRLEFEHDRVAELIDLEVGA